MKLGLFLPISGRAASPETLRESAQTAEALGFDSVWTADRIIIPWEIKTPYPYGKDEHFFVPPDRPFFDPLSCLAFLAGCTEKLLLGMSVLVLPYRHPLYWAKVATTIDHLSRGRLILGVGVGWMVEEFDALGIPFKDRAKLSHEQLQILDLLWKEEKPSFEGKYYRFKEIGFYPKPFQQPRIPIWVGGEGTQAQRRAAIYGDGWFPYFVRITPGELAARFENVRRAASDAGRDPSKICLGCCLPIEISQRPMPQEDDRVVGDPQQVLRALKAYQRIGVDHIALQFMAPRYPERVAQIERFGKEVLPALHDAE